MQSSNQGGGRSGSGGKGPWGSGPQSSGPRRPIWRNCCAAARISCERVPGGNVGAGEIALIAIALMALWGFSGFFRVEPDELGVVLRFGKYVRDAQPGLRYHLPYPIKSALTPKALRVNKIDIGMRIEDIRRGTSIRALPEEGLMLTGDENIVEIEFSVFWVVKPAGVADYLFNIQNPEGTVKAVAESAMREVIGRSQIQPILTGARQSIEGSVADLMQKTLDHYGAGIQVTQVQLQKVDPPAQVLDSFRTARRRSMPNGRRTRRRPMPTGSSPRGAAAWRRSPRRPKPIASRPSPRRPVKAAALPQGLRGIPEGTRRDPAADVS